MRTLRQMGLYPLLLSTLLGLIACQPLIHRPLAAAPTQGSRLAYIGSDGNVYVVGEDLRSKEAITQDADSYAAKLGRSYHQLAWSRTGWLAFAAVEPTAHGLRSDVYVAAPGLPAQWVGSDEENFVIYFYWSPVCCQLSYLIEQGKSMALRLVTMPNALGQTAAEPTQFVRNAVVGTGRPFYYTWAADGTQMLWHTGGARRENPAASFTRFDLAQQDAAELAQPPGYLIAPAWSPAGKQWLEVIEVAGEMALRMVVVATGQATTLVTNRNDIAFTWSPDGRQVAYAMRSQPGDPFLSPIHVYDLATGTDRTLTAGGLHVLAFFWSPDSQRLGYINWLALPNENWMQWRVYDLTTQSDRGFNAFYPSFPMQMLVGSFEQYAQSHQLWSPDGRYLVYANRDRALVERIWLVDTQALKGTKPILVDEGELAVWSWQ